MISWHILRRRAAIVVLAASAIGTARAAEPKSDAEIVAEMQQRIKALQQKIVGHEDLAETAKIQAEMSKVMEETLDRVSPKSRPMLEIGLKLMRPLSEQGVAYTEAMNAFFSGPSGSPGTIQAKEEIPRRIAEVEKLIAMNQKLLDRVNAMEGEAEKLIKKSGASAREQEAFMQGYRNSSGKKMGALRAIRTLDTKVLGLWIDLLRLLEGDWGKWRAAEDGALEWDDQQAEAKAAAIVEEINVLAQRQVVAQQAIVDAK